MELFEIIMEWAAPILMFDMPKESWTIAFNITKFVGKKWDLCLQGLKKIPEDKYKTIEWSNRTFYSSSMTSNTLTWESEGDYYEEIDKLLRVFRRIVNEDNEVSVLLKKYKEVVVGGMEVIEVLYSE